MFYILSTILSFVTVWVLWQAGNHNKSAWSVGLLEKAAWMVLLVVYGHWTLFPITVARMIAYGRNWLKWKREDQSRSSFPRSPASGLYQHTYYPIPSPSIDDISNLSNHLRTISEKYGPAHLSKSAGSHIEAELNETDIQNVQD